MSSALTGRPSGMGELVITTFMTLDGVMQAPGGRDEDREDGFEHGGWQAPVSDPASGDRMYEEFQTWDAYLLGRRTYDIFASFWPNQPDDPFTRLINDLPRYVASRTLTEGRLGGHDHPRRRRRRSRSPSIKERHERIGLWGSADLVQTLLRHDLVDCLDLWIYPLLLGHGQAHLRGGHRSRSVPPRRRSRPSTAARSTPSTSTPARRRTGRWATGARPARACSCAADEMRRPRGEDAAGVVCAAHESGEDDASRDAALVRRARAGARGRTSTPSRPRGDSGR